MSNTFESNLLMSKEKSLAIQHPENELPENFFMNLLDDQIGRGYLSRLPKASDWQLERAGMAPQYGWLKFERLPIKPGREEENTLLDNWQSVLSACHSMNLQLAFVIIRKGSQIELYLGATSIDGEFNFAAEKFRESVMIHMPGAELSKLDRISNAPKETLKEFNKFGVVTGIPSLRNDRSGISLQSLDKLARGIRIGNDDKNYALVVLAKPVSDGDTAQLIKKFIELKSDIHQFGGSNVSENFNTQNGQTAGKNFNIGAIIYPLAMASLYSGNPLTAVGGFMLMSLFGGSKSKSQSYSFSTSASREYRDFVVKYCEDLIDKNIVRMERGRNLGFWQTGIYTLTEDDITTEAVLGILRSIYSGRDSHIEPIRIFNAGQNIQLKDYISKLQFLPLPEIQIENSVYTKTEIRAALHKELGDSNGWHIFGSLYENFATALTTEELSIASSLPRREVPGLRLVKSDVSFANNIANFSREDIELGALVDMGVKQNVTYSIPKDALVRHILVGGLTGTGKSTTCKRIIKNLRSRGIPVLIIEPAKDDYVRWAIEQNRNLPLKDRYNIFMPGVEEIDGVVPARLFINIFQPAAYNKLPVNFIQHAEAVINLLNAALPAEDVVPILIEESVHEAFSAFVLKFKDRFTNKIDLNKSENPSLDCYPNIDFLMEIGDKVIDRKTYDKKVKDGFKEVLRTRFKYLCRGTRGEILNIPFTTNFDTLFNQPTVINLSRLAGTKDKSLIMSLLLLALNEYRNSRYNGDAQYRAQAQKNELLHLAVLEEAHNVLKKPATFSTNGNAQQAVAELFGNMLSEIRSYGQGMMIIDQVPTRLIEDAVKNTSLKIAHRLIAPDDVELMASAMVLRQDQAQVIPALQIGDAIICGDMDDRAAWVKIER